ncbi:MAG: thioredoxin family protein [Candidatus Obscuribacterales bacterium]|nr:thioredoxin family protein [Candidatus Obscuribacterales bacterium]
MRLILWKPLYLASLLALTLTNDARAESSIFSKYTLEQAKLQAQKDDKVLLMDFTASWCPPCKRMEATTWVDVEVMNWVKENAIAVQFDVDKEEKASETMRIEAMPTVILFTPKSSREFGRKVGYMSAPDLLRWLKEAKGDKGHSSTQTTEQSTSGNLDVWSHINKARETSNAGKNEEALAEYVWLWNNLSTSDETERDLRKGLIPFEAKKLLTIYPPAKAKFIELREAAEKADKRGDWIILNGMLSENGRTVAWFDKIKVDPKQRDVIRKHFKALETVLFSENRWADAATYLYVDPLESLKEIHKEAEALKAPRPNTEISKDFDPLPSMVLLLYGTYVGAGRDADAKKIEDECLRLDDTPAMRTGLANMAKGMKSAREQQQKKAIKPAGK